MDCGSGMHYKKDRNAYTCGKYGKFGKKHCSSHVIKADVLLSKVISTLKEFTVGGVNAKKLADIAKKESGQHGFDYKGPKE